MRAADLPGVEALVARAFGPGRYAKAAERLREGNQPLCELSIVACAAGRIIGCARQWPVRIGATPSVLLGPFAVEADFRGRGVGAALIRAACEAAASAGKGLVLLVGDEAYFAPLGFSAAPMRRVVMPGPVDQRRVLACALNPGAADSLSGPVRVEVLNPASR